MQVGRHDFLLAGGPGAVGGGQCRRASLGIPGKGRKLQKAENYKRTGFDVITHYNFFSKILATNGIIFC
jgi:hypothetical protein